jgi:hypothetical protein
MSVQINQYIILGCKFDYDEFETAYLGEEGNTEDMLDKYADWRFDAKIVEYNGLSMIFDDMRGEYVYVGKIYAKSADGEYLDSINLDTLNQTEDYRILLKSLINLVFNKTSPIDHFDINLYLVTQYS